MHGAEIQERNYFRLRGIQLRLSNANVSNSTSEVYLRHQMSPKRLTEPGKTKLPLGRRRASLVRRAEYPRSYGTEASAADKFFSLP